MMRPDREFQLTWFLAGVAFGCAVLALTRCATTETPMFKIGDADCMLVHIEDSSDRWLCCGLADQSGLWCKPEKQMLHPKVKDPELDVKGLDVLYRSLGAPAGNQDPLWGRCNEEGKGNNAPCLSGVNPPL